MNLADVFSRAAAEDRAALIGYIPAGYPDLPTSIDVATTMVAGGCDVIEVGIPFSDPTMDGPVIEAASRQALAQGTHIPQVLEVIEHIARTGAAPLVMSYYNPIFRYGVDKFARDLKNAGGEGIITPDLIVDEAGEWIAASDTYDLSRIFLIAPSSTEERIALTTQACRGFVYAASVMGVTGARAQVSDQAQTIVARAKAHTSTPVSVGLGVKNKQQAAHIAQYADGVIVGSAFVNVAKSGSTVVRELAEELSLGVRQKVT